VVVVAFVDVASPAVTTLFPAASYNAADETRVVVARFAVTALPLKVTKILFNATEPAVFAETVIVPKISGFDFEWVEPPIGAAVAVSTLRKIVCALPVAPETELTVAVLLDDAPIAVTLAVEAIEKVCTEPSVAPAEAYEDASPFNTTEIPPPCGMRIGVEKWNA
jgi:hypothetical protein